MSNELREYIVSNDAYPIVGATVEDDGSFAAWHDQKLVCIAGVIADTLSVEAINKARAHAELGVTVEGEGEGDYEAIPCVIVGLPPTKWDEFKSKDSEEKVLVIFVTFMDDGMGDRYALEGEMFV